MRRAPLSDSLCRLSAYLEELEAAELKKFKLHLSALPGAEAGRIPWGRLEAAGPLDTARLLVAHCGPRAAWPLALGLFRRIDRRDLWERGHGEDPARDAPPDGPSSLRSESACSLEVFPGTPRKDPRETYKDHVRRKFRLMEDRNARLGECVNLSRRYTRLLLVKEHSTPLWAQQKLLDTGWGQSRAMGPQASLIQMETLFEPDEDRPEPPRTVVLQGGAGMGKSMLAHKAMLDWADGKLFQDRFDYVFYINCREMNRSAAEQSAQDLISSCWPEPSVPLQEIVRVPERLLFIIDGFDELKPSFHDPQGPRCLSWEDRRPPELLLSSLLQKKLLPELSVIITTRPTALEKLQRLLGHPRHVEILGFSEAERQEYFYKYFHDAEQAGQVFSFVRDNEPLFTLCFVPMVCWVVCTCLKQQLEDGGLLRQTSRTTTAVYTLYLLSLMLPGVEMLCRGLRHPRLRKCQLEASACQEIASVLSTSRHLVELDLAGNPLEDLGLRFLCQGLKHPGCRLRVLWLKICQLSAAACEDLASTLSVNRSLTELDLSLNDLGDPGVLLLCEGLRRPQCRLQTLRLDGCGLTATACEDLASALGISQTLTELYLTNNALGNAGVRLLCKGLSPPGCKLRVLWLFGMDLNKMTHRRLDALRGAKPHLDIGC
ncbi:NACHT, LRR and PYD domains-containing protein 12 isoform X2 [Suricata suricatta]|uniref:NACHT, LRR and PYD domains-containing protein 12 isoform X2 n=1 Tax=Suricata suricatta TaxID=37032 RepID=UPI0011552AC4|nr:NACHT, LRR and PYD domains-containing protein 12 isoform X2 [Suricata suricatta]